MGPNEERGQDHSLSFAGALRRSVEVAEIAEIAIRDGAGVQPGEKVLIVTDNAADPQLTDLLAHYARAAGGETIVVSFAYAPTIHDLPERVASIIGDSDVVIPVCQSRILYCSAIKSVRTHGRLLYMADFPTELLLRPVVREADYSQLAAYGDAFRALVGAGGELRVTTPAGTDASMQMVAGRRVSVSKCRVRQQGDHDYLPGGAWFGCPEEDSVNGTFVIDCSMEPGVTGGIVAEPVVIEFRAGRIVELTGGAEATEFRAWLDSCDEKIWSVSHNGGGFNAKAGRIGNLMEDERILGSFNIAGGNNQSGWPGSNDSAFHWDAMMLAASYSLDGADICQEGVFVHPALTALPAAGS